MSKAQGLAAKATLGGRSSIPKAYAKLAIHTVIDVPAGECPISFKSVTLGRNFPTTTEIIEWFHQVRELGLENGVFYTGVAISFWARCDFDCFSFEYEAIHNAIMSYATSMGEYEN